MVEPEGEAKITLAGQIFGLFGDCQTCKRILSRHADHTLWLPLRGIDCVLRGISQVVFVSNPISGLLILIGLFLGGTTIGLGTLVCTILAALSAVYFKQNSDTIQDGLTQFNGVLVGSVVFALYPVLYGGTHDIRMWIITMVGAVLSVPIQVALGGILNGAKASFIEMDGQRKEYGIPGFTFPFNLTAILLLSILQKFAGKEDSAVDTVVSEDGLDGWLWFLATIKSMGEVYAVDTLAGSILMYIGVAIYSPLLAVVEFMGAGLGTLTAFYLVPEGTEAVYAGIWGYCPLLTAGAIGGYFAILTPRSTPLVLLGILSTVAVQIAVQPVMQVCKLPVFTIPFVLTSWFCLLVNTDNSTLIRTSNPTVPEVNVKAWLDSRSPGLTGHLTGMLARKHRKRSANGDVA